MWEKVSSVVFDVVGRGLFEHEIRITNKKMDEEISAILIKFLILN